jgi:hypothetical protein
MVSPDLPDRDVPGDVEWFVTLVPEDLVPDEIWTSIGNCALKATKTIREVTSDE